VVNPRAAYFDDTAKREEAETEGKTAEFKDSKETRESEEEDEEPTTLSLSLSPSVLPNAEGSHRTILSDVAAQAKRSPLESAVLPNAEGSSHAILSDLAAQVGCSPLEITEVAWCKGVYSMPAESRLANTLLYKRGLVYGLDVASAAAVAALKIDRGHHCLDLCCAPGAKLVRLSRVGGVRWLGETRALTSRA
jgi:16S rRNA C967 or C1407 C5-methylase (RsmB/RsmF family)